MSTVHEVIVARHSNMKVFGFSLITNECVTEYDTEGEANHQEVIDVGRERGPVLQKLVSRMVAHIGSVASSDSDGESSNSSGSH
ncbi:hypothetical protein B566_EDAN011553 [Ephemera danica]|nr:hypothetical protein B566_EDAN011553 [Ephemera danica]